MLQYTCFDNLSGAFRNQQRRTMSAFDWIMVIVAIVLAFFTIWNLIGDEPDAALVTGIGCALCVAMVVL